MTAPTEYKLTEKEARIVGALSRDLRRVEEQANEELKAIGLVLDELASEMAGRAGISGPVQFHASASDHLAISLRPADVRINEG